MKYNPSTNEVLTDDGTIRAATDEERNKALAIMKAESNVTPIGETGTLTTPTSEGLMNPIKALGEGLARSEENMATRAAQIGTYIQTHPFSPEATAERQGIANNWVKQQAQYQNNPNVMNHPDFAMAGQQILPSLMSGGRSPVMGLLRGAMAGWAQYNPDVTQSALNTTLGGVLGAAGSQIANNFLTNRLGQKVENAGLEALPEQTGPTFFPSLSKHLYAGKVQAFKANKGNQKEITNLVLKDLGDNGDKFTDETLKNAKIRIQRMFNEATGSKENLLFNNTQPLDDIGNLPATGGQIKSKADQIKEYILKNKNIMPVEDYHRFRSDVGDSLRGTKDGNDIYAYGKLLDYLDESAKTNLSPETWGLFNSARSKYKLMTIINKPNINNWESGMVDPNRLHNRLSIIDNNGYVMGRNQSPLYNALRTQAQLQGTSEINSKGTNTLGNARVGWAGHQLTFGYQTKRFLSAPGGKIGLWLNRQPQYRLPGLLPGAGIGAANTLESVLGNQEQQ